MMKIIFQTTIPMNKIIRRLSRAAVLLLIQIIIKERRREKLQGIIPE